MPFNHPDPDQESRQKSLPVPFTSIGKLNAGEKLFFWRIGQGVSFAASIVLIDLLLFVPELGLDLLWNILIPLAPAIIVILPGLWRNICPLATMNLLPQYLDISSTRLLSRKSSAWLGFSSLVLLAVIVPYRHIGLDYNGVASAMMLVCAGVLALSMGFAFEGRGGWCGTLCPVHPVEKLYGFAPAMRFRNARCVQCSHCTKPCPDSTRSLTPAISARSPLAEHTGLAMIGGFAGFVWGWFQIPDFVAPITLSNIQDAYLWPLGSGVVSLAVFSILYHRIMSSKPARQMLVKIFATTAVSIYYWYRIPALVGLGPHHGTGMLYNLSSELPLWIEDLSHLLTTSFFIWFMMLRKSPAISWLKRPVVVNKRDRQAHPQSVSY